MAEKIERYRAAGARVSLFMDPVESHIAAARTQGADRIELYTGPFAETIWTHGPDHADSVTAFTTYQDAARYASQLGLGVNAGHDLDLGNLSVFCRIEEVAEVSIGHALISDALEYGLFETTRKYLALTSPS